MVRAGCASERRQGATPVGVARLLLRAGLRTREDEAQGHDAIVFSAWQRRESIPVACVALGDQEVLVLAGLATP